jgi:hypothetical protein
MYSCRLRFFIDFLQYGVLPLTVPGFFKASRAAQMPVLRGSAAIDAHALLYAFLPPLALLAGIWIIALIFPFLLVKALLAHGLAALGISAAAPDTFPFFA